MNTQETTAFAANPEDFGASSKSDKLVVAPADELQSDVPQEAARYGWTAGIMARFAQVLIYALGLYALHLGAELLATDERTPTLRRKAKDADVHRTKLSNDLERLKPREAQAQDELRAMLDELNATRKRNAELEDATRVNHQQLEALRSENASLEAWALQRETDALEEAQARTRSLEHSLDSAQTEIMRLKQDNSGLASELQTARADHVTRTTSLEAEIKSLNEQIFTLEHNSQSQHHRSTQTRSNAARMDKALLLFKAHYKIAHKQNTDLREAAAAVAAENQVLRADKARLATSNTLAQQEVYRLQVLVSTQSHVAALVPEVASAVQGAPAPGSSSFGFGMFGIVASSMVSAIASTPRSLSKAVMGLGTVGSDDGFTSPV